MTDDFATVESSRCLMLTRPTFLHSRPVIPAGSRDRKPVPMTGRQTALLGLQLALDDKEVFASITGPKFSGKSQTLADIVNKAKAKSRVCITILNPGEMGQSSIDTLKRSMNDAASRLDKQSVSILIAIDNSHLASHHLLKMLTILARERNFPPTQAILAGEAELWSRLDLVSHSDLMNRLAIRFQLKAA